MNKIFGIGILALSITACNNGIGANNSNEIEANLAHEIRIKEQQDSLKLDSFQKAESEKVLALEQQRETESLQVSKQNSTEQIHSVTNTSTPSTAHTPEKKGWSDAAKGTAIGAGVGAGVGALIDKDKRLRGAAIGAAIGGGSGYAIGRKSDRESGRVQKK